MTAATRNGLIAFIVAAIVIVGGFAYEQLGAPSRQEASDVLPLGGPFTLVDANGTTRHDNDFRGKAMLIYFGYTFCPDVCPTTLTMMGEAMAKLGPAAAGIVPIFVTVDPARDTPPQMKQYIASFDPRFVALTGSASQIAAVAGEYHVYYRKAAGEGRQYTMDHSSEIYLLSRDGAYLAHFDSDIGANDLAQALRKYL